jgi:hypothetical protein
LIVNQNNSPSQRCKKYTPSIVTPLDEEGDYRYHEGLIAQQLKEKYKYPTFAPPRGDYYNGAR